MRHHEPGTSRQPAALDRHAEPDPGDTLKEADFDALVRDNWRRLVQLSLLLVGEQAAAEDVVQDAFAALYPRWHQMRNVPGAAAYLRTSVVNGSRSALRHRGVANRALPHLAREDEAPADARLLADERRRDVLDTLGRLPRRQREVLVLRYWLDLSEADIAATLSISRGSVKSSTSRAIAKLTAEFGGDK